MNDVASIIAWIQTLPTGTDTDTNNINIKPHPDGSKKRTFTSPLVSPPTSWEDDWMDPTPTKRRRFDGALADPDTTPRPGARRVTGSSASSLVPTDSSSFVSTTSSIKRQMMHLRLDESGVECKALDMEAPPDTARTLVNAMRLIGRSLDILPHALESTLMDRIKARNLDQRQWRYSFKPADEMDTLPGRLPKFEEVERIHRKAKECQEFNHEEVSWNHQVHLRLLESIFEEFIGGQCDNFNAMNCTTARPHAEFRPLTSMVKMIDICVYASFDRDAETSASITKLSNITPTQTINHTDFEPTSTRPILLSIETKKPGVNWDKAQLQIGIWHAAQWSFLRWAVGQKLLRQRAKDGIDMPQSGEEQEEFKAKKLAILSELGFIPGIIIQGHGWHLVLSTYEDGKTKLWGNHQFGTTHGFLEIYAVIAGMRELTAWARDVYLPWFKTNVLD